jgi:hypothetical protein
MLALDESRIESILSGDLTCDNENNALLNKEIWRFCTTSNLILSVRESFSYFCDLEKKFLYLLSQREQDREKG